MSTGPTLNPATPQYNTPPAQARRPAEAQETNEANQAQEAAAQAETPPQNHLQDSANQVRGVQGLTLPVDLGDHFSRKQVDRANRLVDQLSNGKLPEAERTAKTLQFTEAIKGLSDDQLLDVARYIGQNMAKFDGHDQTLNALFQNVLDQVDNQDLRNSLHGCDPREAFKASQVAQAISVIDEMATGRNNNPEQVADQALRFEKSLEGIGMSDDQLLNVARHIGDKMAKTDGNDPLLGRMLMLVLDRMEEPNHLLNDPIFDRLPLPDRMPPFPWPGTPQGPIRPRGDWEPLPTPTDPMPYGIDPPSFPDIPGPQGGGDPDLDWPPGPIKPIPDTINPPGGPWGDFPWPTTPPTFPWPECPPDIHTFGDLKQYLAQNDN